MKKLCLVIKKIIVGAYNWFRYDSETIEFKGLPRGCWYCEVLGLCRAPKEEGWKCYNGCMITRKDRCC